MINPRTLIIIAIIFSVLTLNVLSAVSVNADYITIYPGQEGKIIIEVDNNENFDIEDVSITLDTRAKTITNSLGVVVSQTESLPFAILGNSEKEIEDIDKGDDDKSSFSIKASANAKLGDYNLPYVLKYTNADNRTDFEKSGSFGIRVSAKTEIDFAVEAKGEETGVAIVGEKGRVSLKIINRGLGEIKFVSVGVFPQGYELLSGEKVYVGNIVSDDSDFASFDVVFKSISPTLSAKVSYKDVENKEQSEIVEISFKVYTREKAIELGLIKEKNYAPYYAVGGIIILWLIWRKIKKARKNKQRGKN